MVSRGAPVGVAAPGTCGLWAILGELLEPLEVALGPPLDDAECVTDLLDGAVGLEVELEPKAQGARWSRCT
jgi:hypothetical protein